jgi:6-phosphogluconolactonase
VTRLTTCVDAETVARRAAVDIARHLQRARQDRGVAHLALSGGTSPERTYELLAREQADWTGIDVWFADERCVPPDSKDSNYRLAAETLLEPAGIPHEQVHRMEGELGPLEGARRYAEALRAHVSPQSAEPPPKRAAPLPDAERTAPGRDASRGRSSDPIAGRPGIPALDLIVLGIGPDGHVASLFPDADTLRESGQALCLPVRDSPKPPAERITLSLPVLRAARRCLLLASGAGKADALRAMLADPSRDVPASLLRRDRLTLIVDDAASPTPVRG